MYIIENNNLKYDMHIRKKFNSYRNKKILIKTYSNKLYFGKLVNYSSMAEGNKIVNTQFIIRSNLNNGKIILFGFDVKNLYLETYLSNLPKVKELEFLSEFFTKKTNSDTSKIIFKFIDYIFFYKNIS
tara:strand:+ start:761 stop:1144 length:384 start_codon:yes stop_codon:yes gene_type:complete